MTACPPRAIFDIVVQNGVGAKGHEAPALKGLSTSFPTHRQRIPTAVALEILTHGGTAGEGRDRIAAV